MGRRRTAGRPPERGAGARSSRRPRTFSAGPNKGLKHSKAAMHLMVKSQEVGKTHSCRLRPRAQKYADTRLMSTSLSRDILFGDFQKCFLLFKLNLVLDWFSFVECGYFQAI